jgi:hypothetical protein
MTTLAEELVSAVARRYPDDPSAASVTLSEIRPGEFYGSICRYSEPYGEGKTVVTKASASNLLVLVRILAEKWLLSGVRCPELQKKVAEAARSQALGERGR